MLFNILCTALLLASLINPNPRSLARSHTDGKVKGKSESESSGGKVEGGRKEEE